CRRSSRPAPISASLPAAPTLAARRRCSGVCPANQKVENFAQSRIGRHWAARDHIPGGGGSSGASADSRPASTNLLQVLSVKSQQTENSENGIRCGIQPATWRARTDDELMGIGVHTLRFLALTNHPIGRR